MTPRGRDAELESAAARAAELEAAALAPSTRHGYGDRFEYFRRWCEAHTAAGHAGFDALPASGRTLARFIAERTLLSAPNSVRNICVAVAHAHEEAGLANPYADDLARATLAAAAHAHRTPPKPVRALGVDALAAMVSLVPPPENLGTLRNRCAVVVAYDAGVPLRQLVKLRWDGVDQSGRDSVLVRFPGVVPGRAGPGMGAREIVLHAAAEPARCPVRTLQAMRRDAPRQASLVFGFSQVEVGVTGHRPVTYAAVDDPHPIATVLANQLSRGIPDVQPPGAPYAKFYGEGFTEASLTRYVHYLYWRDRRNHLRDTAMILLAFVATLRPSEVVELRVSDLQRRPEGLLVTVRGGKSDLERRGRWVAVPPSTRAELCPVRAVDAWLQAMGAELGPDDPVFPAPIGVSGGLAHGQGSRNLLGVVLKARAAAAGVDVTGLGGRSARRGGITAMLAAGASVEDTAVHARHDDLRTTARYFDADEAGVKGAAARRLHIDPPPTGRSS
ncbi:MAG: tyrosine-type recombinase/integrase [Acidimicrobiales bacterium]